MQENENKTIVEINAEKEVSLDMVTKPEDIKSELLDILNNLRNKDIDVLLSEMSKSMSPEQSKEVASSANFGDSQSTMAKKFIISFIVVMVFSIFFGVMMTSIMMP